MEITQDYDEQKTNWLARLTIGDALFGLIVLGTAVFRFFNLGTIPLADGEAVQALAVWQFWLANTAEIVSVGSPAYFTLTALLTQLAGFSDATMRIVPVLFSLGVVVLPRFLQHRLGVVGVLVTTLLLAVSPLNVLIARTVGGDALALFAILLLAVAFIRYQETAASKWLYALAVAVGLGLTSSLLFYSGVLTLLLAGLIQYKFGLPFFESETWVKPESSERKTAVLIGGLIFLLTATMFLWNFIGIGDAARLLGDWFSTIIPTEGRTIVDPLLAIIRYEPLLLVLGLPAVIWALWRSRPTATANLYWVLMILLLILVRQGDMGNAALITLPGYMLIGLFTQAILGNHFRRYAALVAVGFFLALGVIVINVARYMRVATYDAGDIRYLLVAFMALILVFMTVYMLAIYDVSAIYQGTILAILAFYVVVQWGIGFQTANYYANDPRERWVQEGTDVGVRLLTRTATDVSRQITGGTDSLNVLSSLDSPVLAWYLRDLKSLQLGAALPATAVNEVIITPAKQPFPLENQYTGTQFRFKQTGVNEMEANPDTAVYDLLRWWFFHETTAQTTYDDLVLWVKTDRE